MTREEIAVLWQQAVDLIESQAEEIAELDALRNDAVLRLDKYKALCDQMGNALAFIPQSGSRLGASAEEKRVVALKAWRVMK